MDEMNKKQKEEMKKLIDEITDEAKNLVEDYSKNPSDMSGSYVSVHETSPYLKDVFKGESWKKVVYSSDMGKLLEDVKKHNEKVKKNKKDAD